MIRRCTIWAWGLWLLGSCAWISEADRRARHDLDGDGVERPVDCDDDDPSVQVPSTWFPDADGDGYGLTGGAVTACHPPDDHAPRGGDCDDGDPAVNPAAPEVCNGVDDDCDGRIDPADSALLFVDSDGDGFGTGQGTWICGDRDGWAVLDGDCDDADPEVHPDATEVCNGSDDDCDGRVDLEDDSLDPLDATWYLDADGDGFGDDAHAVVTCTPDGDRVAVGGDCNDHDPRRSPAHAERCNGFDDDCDGVIDEDSAIDAPTWFRDQDSDGFGAPFTDLVACLRPVGYVANALDCDDGESMRRPGADEVCDGIDNDCDALVDDDDLWVLDPATWFFDADGDGFGTPTKIVVRCDPPQGYVSRSTDCRDDDATVHPAALEVCDGIDNDCDEDVDDDDDDLDLLTTPAWYADLDGDGHGDPSALLARACIGPPGGVRDASDCDDDDPGTRPGAPELCDARDNDCDGIVDEDTPTTWYRDLDGDGFGDPLAPIADCNPPPGYVLDASDCDDTTASVRPGAPERCDGVDADCDGLSDDDDPDSDALTWYADADHDGFGDPWSTRRACDPPQGYLLDTSDCDDGDPTVSPASPEVCDGQDNDCDALVDDDDPDTTPPTWWFDGDLDGYGDPTRPASACDPPYQHVAVAGDCDDAAPAVHTGAAELCNGVDDDCDGAVDDDDPGLDAASATIWYADADADGFGDPATATPPLCAAPPAHVADGTDCDDARAQVRPGAAELCDGLDNDCDGTVDEGTPTRWYPDVDGDGFGDGSTWIADCNPVAGRVLYAGDCDDADPEVRPGATEICNGVDDDCNGAVDDQDPGLAGPWWFADDDGDGHGDPNERRAACAVPPGFVATDTDCDDSKGSVHPGAPELCNLRDDDCDALADEADPDVVGIGTWYRDRDEDAHGDPLAPVEACAQPRDAVVDATDCDDTDFKVNPSAPEVCDSVDNDCDGAADDADPGVVGRPTWYVDGDADGWGDPATAAPACVQPVGRVAAGGDCDDGDPTAWPGAPEDCDGADDDCNGIVDDQVVYRDWFADRDGDGHGDPGDVVNDCRPHPDRVLVGTDCDDGSAAVHPMAREVCNGSDDDCDGAVDDQDVTVDPSGFETWYVDADGDGFGDAASAMLACQLAGGTRVPGDCDDGRSEVHPGHAEVCDDGLDNDCDGQAPECRLTGQVALGQLPDVLVRELAGDLAGASLAAPGDVDGDGWADLVVGAPGTDGVYLVRGPIGGPHDLALADRLDGTPGDGAGTAIAGAGDLSGDGVADLLVGAPGSDLAGPDRGAVFVVHGPPTPGPLSPAALALYGSSDGEHFGQSVAGPADLDGDGVPDFVVGAPVADHWSQNTGAVYVMSGASLAQGPAASSALAIWSGTTVAEAAGTCVATGADLDGDGRDDVVTGSPGASLDLGVFAQGVVDVLLDPLTGLQPLGSADAHVKGVATGDRVGTTCAMAGDVNGDGYGDFLVGAPQAANGAGRAWLFLGPPSGDRYVTDAWATFTSPVPGAQVGASVAGVGDLDGDGLDDIAIGAPGIGNGAGRVHVFYGAPSGLVDVATADLILEGSVPDRRAGAALTGGDLDGDGKSDLVVGAPGSNASAAWVLFGQGL